MNKPRLVLLCAVLLCANMAFSCGDDDEQPQSGFKAQGEKYVATTTAGVFSFVSVATVSGDWLSDNGNAVGETRSFSFLTGADPLNVDGGRVPARWRIRAGVPGECVEQLTDVERNVTAGSTQVAQCRQSGIIVLFSTAPSSINLQSPPATFEMTGSGVSAAHGMPSIEYVDQYSGQLIGSVRATAVSGDGSWLQAPTPDLSSVYTGTYDIRVNNVRADGGLEFVGVSTVDCYGRDGTYEPPPSEPCPPCQRDMPCMPCNITY